MDYRNSKWNNGVIDCEVLHPIAGWVPFTASPHDVEKYGRDLFLYLSSVIGPDIEKDDNENTEIEK